MLLAAQASDAAVAIPFEAYEQLLVEYLGDEFIEICGRPEVWDEWSPGSSGSSRR